jgi:hypothetical protein
MTRMVAGGEQRGQRRGEPQPARRLGQIDRLDAEPVPAKHHRAGLVLGDREREHPEEVLDAVDAPAVVRLEDHLGVGGGEEAVAVSAQLVAQLLVVVYAAVEDHREAQFVVGHRLLTGLGQVDDLQPPVPEGHRPVLPEALAVRTARLQARQHRPDGVAVRRTSVEPQLAADSTHEDLLACSGDNGR